jgi:hypothetical protein
LIGGLVVLFVSVGLIYLGYWIFFARFNVGTVAWELTERGPIVDLRLLGHKPLGGFSRESILISCFVTQTSPPSEIASY